MKTPLLLLISILFATSMGRNMHLTETKRNVVHDLIA
ncbi:MAG: hypothetical protein DVB23_003364 [Verrucomicrobia bacterium]|nr:MAG: hypothetical protein DVB23_003364 [Verrucomicrobiota bacterium]